MNPLIEGLPEEICEIIGNSDWLPIDAPYSGTRTYLMRTGSNSNSYLKVLLIPHTEPLMNEKERLEWRTGLAMPIGTRSDIIRC